MDKKYLGDGVYASHDGYQIVLTTERGGRTETICLDHMVFSSLLLFVEKLHGVSITVRKIPE